MKKFLKYTGIVSALLAVVTFILMMTTPAVLAAGKNSLLGNGDVPGVEGIFGNSNFGAPWTGILAWILVLVALVILIAAIILPVLKINALEKFAGVLNLVAVVALIGAGILMFMEVVGYRASIGEDAWSVLEAGYNVSVGAGWIIAGILSIAGGVIAILPAAMDFVAKKK